MRLRLATLCSMLTIAGCSLMGLGDDLEREGCTRDEDGIDSCASLNDPEAPGFDPCRPWQCNDQTGFCEIDSLDADADDHTPAECADELRIADEDIDCDDGDDTRFPGNEETCDDEDNDCDGRVDEGALETRTTKVVASISDPVTRASFARQQDDGQALAIAYVQLDDRQSRRSAFADFVSSRLTPDTPAQPTSLAVQERTDIQPADMAATPLDDGDFALAAIDENAPQRVIAGVLTSQGLQVGDAAWDGLPCGDGETCPPQPDTTTPAIAALGEDVLVAYVRDDPDRRQCLDASEAPVWLNLLRRPGSTLEPEAGPAVSAGATTDRAAPALFPISHEAGWLLGTVQSGAVIRLQRVQVDGDTLSVETLEEITASRRPHDLALGLAPETADSRQGMLLHLEGCANDSRLLLHRFTLRGDGAAMLEMEGDAVALDTSTGIKAHPAIAYAAARDTWMAVWRNDGQGPLLGRAWSPDGTLRDEQPMRLLEGIDGDTQASGAHPFIFAYDTSAENPWFGVTSYATERAGSNAGAFYGTRVGCFTGSER